MGRVASSPLPGQPDGCSAGGRISLDFSHPPPPSRLLSGNRGPPTGRESLKPARNRRGPRDGWNGMTLRILRIIVQEGAISARELARALGITRRAVNYHVRKLVSWGLVERVARSRHDPCQVIRALVRAPHLLPDMPSGRVAKRPPGPRGPSRQDGHPRPTRVGPRRASVEDRALALWCFMALTGQALTTRQAAGLLGVSERTARRLFGWLRERGLVVRAGGRRCPWGFWVPVEPGVLPGPVEHRHSSRAVRHRYRLRPRLSTRSRGPGA